MNTDPRTYTLRHINVTGGTDWLDAYLGDFLDELLRRRGQQGYDQLLEANERVGARYSGEDREGERREAFSAASMLAYDSETLEGLADVWRTARAAERDAMARLTGAIIWASLDGETQVDISARADVHRITVRKALGLA